MPPIVVGFILLLMSFLSSANRLSFEESWSRLQQVSDELKAKKEALKRAQVQSNYGSDMHLPSLDITANYTYMEKALELDLTDLNPIASLDPATLPPSIAQLFSQIPHSAFVTPFTEQDIFKSSLQALWPIYTGGKISAAQAIQKAEVAEQLEALELSKRDLFTQLVDRYYAIAITQSLMCTQKQLVASLNQHFNQALALEKQGQIAKVERLNAEVALENAKVGYRTACRQHDMALIALAKMLHESSVEPQSTLFMIQQSLSVTKLHELTLRQHPALKLLKAKEEQAQGLLKLEKSEYFPKVFLYGNYTLYKDDQLLAKLEPDWLVGIGVKIPVVSHNGRKGKVEAAKGAWLQASYSKAQTQQDLSLFVDQHFRQLEQAKEEFNALKISMQLAKENLRLRQLSFRQGLSSSLEQVDAELKLQAVKTQQISAQYRFIQAYARLMSVSGQLQQFITTSRLQEVKHAS